MNQSSDFDLTMEYTKDDSELSSGYLDKAMTLNSLKDKCNALMKELNITDVSEIDKELAQKNPKKHIHELTEYNELKDVAGQLIAMIADTRSVPMKDILAEMGIEGDESEQKSSKKRHI